MVETSSNADGAALASAIEKLQSVELTYEELAAVADHLLDDEVAGFSMQGLIDWGGVAKNMNIEIGMAGHAGPASGTPQHDGLVMGKGPIPSVRFEP